MSSQNGDFPQTFEQFLYQELLRQLYRIDQQTTVVIQETVEQTLSHLQLDSSMDQQRQPGQQ